MDDKGEGSYDPGWNDPPMFSYESHNSQNRASKPRTFLNKRVAFPLNKVSPSNNTFVDPTLPPSQSNISNLPPPPSLPPILPPPKEIPGQNKEDDNSASFDSSEILETILNNLYSQLDTHIQNNDKNRAEIQRRLNTMKTMWIEGKLNTSIQQKLFLLSEELKSGDVEKADELQKGLMVDHGPACSPWMSGVRYLIHNNRSEQADDP